MFKENYTLKIDRDKRLCLLGNQQEIRDLARHIKDFQLYRRIKCFRSVISPPQTLVCLLGSLSLSRRK